ncbi:TPA: phage tail protein [Escherichia coli]|nr:phage tail protein [Escherichia coli]
MNYVYSAKNNVFFPVILLDSYKAAGWDTSDAVPVEESVQIEFTTYKKGKICMPGADGMPAWGDAPIVTPRDPGGDGDTASTES